MFYCYLCGKSVDILYENIYDLRHEIPGDFSIYYCKRCRIGETYPKVAQKKLNFLYEKANLGHRSVWLRELYRELQRSRAGVFIKSRLDRKGKFIKIFPPSESYPQLLDVGCGVGDWLVLFKMLGFQAMGVDLNPKVVQVARLRGMDAHVKAVEELSLNSERVDIVVLIQLLEHLNDPIAVLQNIWKVLRPGGKLIVAVPNLDSRYRIRFGRYWINWYVPFHIFHFTPASLRKILLRSGFTLEHTFDYTPPSWFLASLMGKKISQYSFSNVSTATWWHYLIFPFLAPLLNVIDSGSAPGTGDCLCAIARKGSS